MDCFAWNKTHSIKYAEWQPSQDKTILFQNITFLLFLVFLYFSLSVCIPRCFCYVLPPVPGMGASILPQTSAWFTWRQEEHELPRCPGASLLAPFYHLFTGALLCPICLCFPHLLWHFCGAPLVCHGFLGHPWRHRLLHVQVGGSTVQYGGGRGLCLLLVQCTWGPDTVQNGGLLHSSTIRECHPQLPLVCVPRPSHHWRLCLFCPMWRLPVLCLRCGLYGPLLRGPTPHGPPVEGAGQLLLCWAAVGPAVTPRGWAHGSHTRPPWLSGHPYTGSGWGTYGVRWNSHGHLPSGFPGEVHRASGCSWQAHPAWGSPHQDRHA